MSRKSRVRLPPGVQTQLFAKPAESRGRLPPGVQTQLFAKPGKQVGLMSRKSRATPAWSTDFCQTRHRVKHADTSVPGTAVGQVGKKSHQYFGGGGEGNKETMDNKLYFRSFLTPNKGPQSDTRYDIVPGVHGVFSTVHHPYSTRASVPD